MKHILLYCSVLLPGSLEGVFNKGQPHENDLFIYISLLFVIHFCHDLTIVVDMSLNLSYYYYFSLECHQNINVNVGVNVIYVHGICCLESNEHEWAIQMRVCKTVSVSLQCGRRGEALRHQQNSHRLWLCRALQPVQLTEGTGLALPAHVPRSAQWLSECHVSIPGLRTPEAMRTSENTL